MILETERGCFDSDLRSLVQLHIDVCACVCVFAVLRSLVQLHVDVCACVYVCVCSSQEIV